MNRVVALCKKLLSNEGFLYIIFGGMTTVLNIVLFWGLGLFLDYKTANFFAIVLSILFAYIVNKIFVFKSKTTSTGSLFKEMLSFFGMRGVTFALDWFGLVFAVETLHWNSSVAKIIIQVLVIILNYILSKLFVFKKP